MRPTPRVVVVGSINVDLHLLLDRHILPGETLLARGGAYSPGGKGANQACASALAGAATTLLGAVGDDVMAATALSTLQEAGVDLSHVTTLNGPTGLAVVSVDSSGENTVVVVPGANALVTPDMVDRWRDRISAAQVVVVQGEISAACDVAAARHTRGRLVLNLAPAIDVPPALLRQADPLVVNEHEGVAALLRLGGPEVSEPSELVAALRRAGVRSVVMTLGPAGSIVAQGQEVTLIPATRVEAVDTVGAGDAFTGALAAKLAEGRSLLDGAAFASRFAAYTVQFVGAQTSYPPVGTDLPGA